MTRPWPGARAVLALATAIVCAAGPIAATADASPAVVAAGAGGTAGATGLRLLSQTSWVDPVNANVFELRVLPTTSLAPDQVDVVVDIYDHLDNRSQLTRSLTDTNLGYILAHPIHAPLSSFPVDAQGAIDIKIPVTAGRGVGEVHPPATGVYPVSVELRPRVGGSPLAHLTTHLLYQAGPINGQRLNVAWVVPVDAPPGPGTGRDRPVSPQADARITALVNALVAHPKVALTVQPTPDTLAGMDAVDPGVVNLLGRSLAGRQVLKGTWVPASLAAMHAAGLDDEVGLSLTRSTDSLSAELGIDVTGRTWVQDGPVDQDTLSFLRGSGFDRVVLPEPDLDASPDRTTTAEPFEVAGANHTGIRAAVADAGLAAHFSDQPDPVLAAHQLLADLAQIYEDAPANRRAVVVVTPRSWTPDAGFLDAWLQGLETSPLLTGMGLDALFATVPPATERGADPLVRNLVTDTDAIHSAAAALLADDQRTARRQLDSLIGLLPEDTTVYPRLERLLLEVPAAGLSPTDRRARLDELTAGIGAETQLVGLPGARTVTLTERKGRLPITITSQSDQPVRVLLRVQSDKLKFPGAGSTDQATFPEELHKGNNPLVPDLTVQARTSGAFPLRITVLSPDGNLTIRQVSWTVQSTALSGVGVVLSVGAALFLMVWWGRHAWRGRAERAGGRRRRRHAPGAPRLAAGDVADAAAAPGAGRAPLADPLGAGRARAR